MATIKHLSSKNSDLGAAERYLIFQHDESSNKPILDADGHLIPREDYRIDSILCGDEDFAIACMKTNLAYNINLSRGDVKTHHYIISFDPRDAEENGLRTICLTDHFWDETVDGASNWPWSGK